jgi:DNA-binding IclR family transcriptional regulator
MTTYIVPCVAKAVHIVEILRMVPSGLHMAELRSITGYPPSTIYRILRTLVGCGYLHHNMRGAYVLNLKIIHAKESEPIVGDRSLHFPASSSYRPMLPR